jgi:hypothetical protein
MHPSHPLDGAVRIRTSQIELLGTLLTRALYDDPAVTYVLPDTSTRQPALSWFFTSVAIRASRLCGETYTTRDLEGGALWICPGVEWTVAHFANTAISALPFKLNRSSITRWINVSGYLESVRRQLADRLHWYLLVAGTEPSINGNLIRRTLLAPVLATADWDLRSCYVETFNERDLPFYKQIGFEIAGAGRIPDGGPSFWALIRPPQRVAKRTCVVKGTEFGTEVNFRNPRPIRNSEIHLRPEFRTFNGR